MVLCFQLNLNKIIIAIKILYSTIIIYLNIYLSTFKNKTLENLYCSVIQNFCALCAEKTNIKLIDYYINLESIISFFYQNLETLELQNSSFLFWIQNYIIEDVCIYIEDYIYLDLVLNLINIYNFYIRNIFILEQNFKTSYPDILFLITTLQSNIYKDILVNWRYTIIKNIYNLGYIDIFLTYLVIFIQFILINIICCIYFNSTITKYNIYYNNQIFLILGGLLYEAEKELSSLDDTLIVGLLLSYIFGIYFYNYSMFNLNFDISLISFFCLCPVLYYIILGIPIFLLYDYGLYFTVYLRGVGSSSNFFVELLYDYISIVVFYTRILVQSVRLIFILGVYLSLQEFILNLTFTPHIHGYIEYTTPQILNSTYIFIIYNINIIIHFLYEIFHMYFVVVIQFIAFLVIVFWLYLFLYTFFISESLETYIYILRKKYKYIKPKFR